MIVLQDYIRRNCGILVPFPMSRVVFLAYYEHRQCRCYFVYLVWRFCYHLIWNVYELSLYCRLIVEFIRVITELHLSNPTFAHDNCWESRLYSGMIWHLCLLIKNTNLVVLFIVITHYDKSGCCLQGRELWLNAVWKLMICLVMDEVLLK